MRGARYRKYQLSATLLCCPAQSMTHMVIRGLVLQEPRYNIPGRKRLEHAGIEGDHREALHRAGSRI